MLKTVRHYCQKCLAANPLGQELCSRCGTRLMLVVEPPAARFDEGGIDASYEEHLLERISGLENRLSRLTDKLEQTLDLLLRQAKNAYFDHTLIETLIGVLDEAGSIDSVKVDREWRQRCQLDTDSKEIGDRRERQRGQLLSSYRGADPSFARNIEAGFDFFGRKETDAGTACLERAAALDARNHQLDLLLGELYFDLDQYALAKDHLERAIGAGHWNDKSRLLLGLLCGDAGEFVRSKEILESSIESAGESFVARCGLGLALAAELKWTNALKQFKKAIAANELPEGHFILGCAYYELGRNRLAARHLYKALELDSGYAAAAHALGQALTRLGQTVRARAAFELASNLESANANAGEAKLKRRRGRFPHELLFSGKAKRKSGRILGDPRISASLKRQVLG